MGDHPVFFAFSLANHHRPTFVINAAPAQVNKFHAAHAGAVKRFQHGPVTHAGEDGHVRHVEDFVHLVAAQNMYRQALFHPRQIEVGSGVIKQTTALGQSFKPHPYRHGSFCLAAGRQRFAVGFLIHKKMPLVTLQSRPSNLLRQSQTTFVTPADKSDQQILAFAQGMR